MGFHVLPEGAGVSVALVAAPELAEVWLVAGVDMAVLLAVGTVGESPVTTGKLTGEGLLSWNIKLKITNFIDKILF